MPHVDLEKERRRLDREITFFHYKRAEHIRRRALAAAEKEQNRFFILYFKAQQHILAREHHKALPLLEEALTLRRGDGCTYNDKALCLAELDCPGEALACFNEGIRRDPDCVTVYHNKGWLLNLLSHHARAVLCFKKTLELDPRRPEALYSLADSCEHMGEYAAAEKYFHAALREVTNRCSYMVGDIKTRLKRYRLR